MRTNHQLWNRKRSARSRSQRLSCEQLEDRHLLSGISFLPGDGAIGPSHGNQHFVAVEEGGPGFLAVWTDERAVISGSTNSPGDPLAGNMRDIYGQVLDPNGQPLGPQIVIADEGMGQKWPDVAWNESAQAWLVAYGSQNPDWYFEEQVVGVRVAADGTVLDPDPILLFDDVALRGPYSPTVASDGTNWVAVTDDFIGVSLGNFARRIGSDGTLVDAHPILFEQADFEITDIAYVDNVFMTVGRPRAGGSGVSYLRMDTALNVLSGPISVDSETFSPPTVDDNGVDQFLIVADHAQRVTSAGQNLDPAGIPYAHGTDSYDFHDVAWTGQEWAIAMFIDGGFQQSDITLQRISSDGVMMDPTPLVVEPDVGSIQQALAIAGDGNGGASIVYPHPGNPLLNVHATQLNDDGTFGQPTEIAVGLSRQIYPTLVDGPGDENLAVFLSQNDAGASILAQRVTDQGVVLDPEPTVVANLSFLVFQLSVPEAAWNGSEYLVAWDDPTTGNVVGKRISANNAVIDAQPIVIVDDVALQDLHFTGAITALGNVFMVGVIEEIRVHEPVQYAKFVRVRGSDGAVLDAAPRSIYSGGHVRTMTAGTVGDRALFAWAQWGNHDSTTASIQAGFVDEFGTVTGPFFISEQRGKQPDIAVNGNQALVVWHDNDATNRANIEGRFVLADGTMPDGEFLISGAENEQWFPAVGWTGDQYMVAWSDYRHVEGVQQMRADIRASRVAPDGMVRDPNGLVVTETVSPEDLPTVVGGGGNSLIMFTALGGANGVKEIQRLAYQVGPVIEFSLLPFAPIEPSGSLVSSSIANSGFLTAAAEFHAYDFFAEAGESLTAIVTPDDPGVTLTAEFVGLGSNISAPAPGEPVSLPLVAVAESGNVTLSISGDTASLYHIEIYRNTNVEALTETAGPVAIDDSFFELGSGRYSALGQSTATVGSPGFVHYNDPSLFIDISATGQNMFLGRDDERSIFTTVGNSLLPAGLTLVGNDGAIMDDRNESIPPLNFELPYIGWPGNGAALAVFWDELNSNVLTGGVFWEERLVNGTNTLIVQWEKLAAHQSPSTDEATFQVQVFETGPVLARYAYKDVDFGDPVHDAGASATIGIQFDQTTADQFSYNTPVISDGDVVDYVAAAYDPDVDDYTIELQAGNQIDVALLGLSQHFEAQTLEILDSAGNVLATGATTSAGLAIDNYDQGILDFQVPATGTYTVRVSSDLVTADYSLVVTEDLVYDTEPNQAIENLRSLDGTGGALGYLSGDALVSHSHYNDPSLFVDISATGIPLGMTEDGETTVTTTVGNAAFPAGLTTIGNNGVVASGPDVFISFVNSILPNYQWDAALVPFWTDLGVAIGDVYYEERLVDGINTLIVQWDDIPHLQTPGTVTFQLQLFETGPIVARYVYPDVDFGNPIYDGGNQATVGLQLNQTTAGMFSRNEPSLSNGDVIDYSIVAGDRYTLDLAAGETVTLQTKTPLDDTRQDSPNALDPVLIIYDASGVAVLDSDSNSARDGKNAALTFTAPIAGTYVVAVVPESGTGAYVLNVDPAAPISGDFDNDGDYDTDDINALTTAIVTGGNVAHYDLSGDGMLQLDDVDIWRQLAGEANLGTGHTYLAGDADLDGVVDGVDFLAWNQHKFTADALWSHGDFNANGVVDGLDFLIWNTNKFTAADQPAGFARGQHLANERLEATREFEKAITELPSVAFEIGPHRLMTSGGLTAVSFRSMVDGNTTPRSPGEIRDRVARREVNATVDDVFERWNDHLDPSA